MHQIWHRVIHNFFRTSTRTSSTSVLERALNDSGKPFHTCFWVKGTQDPGQRLSTPVQFFKLWSHWSKNDGSNLGSHWWKYCLRICAKPNIWNNNNVRNWTFIVLQGVIRAVDQGKGSHQQAQPLPEVRVFYLAYLQKHLFALWMGSGEAQIWRWSEWDLGTWGLGSHESGEDEA